MKNELKETNLYIIFSEGEIWNFLSLLKKIILSIFLWSLILKGILKTRKQDLVYVDSLFIDFRNTDNTEQTWEIYLTFVKLELRNQKCYEENCLEQPAMDFVGYFGSCVGGRLFATIWYWQW